MADVALHITINKAGDPEKLAALVNAALAANESETKTETVVPNGYHCVECYRDDGKHEMTCSCGAVGKRDGASEEQSSAGGSNN